MAKKIVNLETATVEFDFTKDGGEKLAVALSELPAEIVQRLALHGLSQKGGDSYAAAKNQANPVAWAQEQVKGIIESLKKGVFNAGRTGEGTARVSILARALHNLKIAAGEASTEAEAQAFVDSLSKEQVAEYKGKKKVARELDKIRLADAKARLERAEKAAAAGLSDEEDGDEE